LIKLGLGGENIKYAHSLIGRSIFIRYLEDRGILTKEYFETVADKDPVWRSQLNSPLNGEEFLNDSSPRYYLRVLGNKEFTYALYNKLTEDFNGDMFPQDNFEQEFVREIHLKMLQKFLSGDVDEQQRLFFWAYQFDIIPLELISSIYEEFYHNERETDDKGTHYTPSALVEFLLGQVLTLKQLDSKPRILDPACGSGIFLVEAYRRLVRHRMIKEKVARLDHFTLREMLKNQIAGIETNEEALRVTAFSLYLAFLDHQEPPGILEQVKNGMCLPKLKVNSSSKYDKNNYNILLKADAFYSDIDCDMNKGCFGENCSDIVIGNPPWGKAEKPALEWCEKNKQPVGDTEYSQAFIWRTLFFLRDKGVAGLLLSTGVFLKHQSNSKRFRKHWLASIKLLHVVNFVHVRDIFFKNPGRAKSAIAPFASVVFKNEFPETGHRVSYWSAKKSVKVQTQQAVILSKNDLHLIKQSELLRDDTLWKIYWWGSHQDVALIRILRFYPSLKEIAKKKGWIIGQGYTPGNQKDSELLCGRNEIEVNNLARYGEVTPLLTRKVPPRVHRQGKTELYQGDRILIKRGISERDGTNGKIISRLESSPFCFRNSIHCIKLINSNEVEQKVILAIFWSSLARYYLFLTTSSWGTWHNETHLDEIKNMPIKLPTNSNDELSINICEIVDKLRNWSHRERNLYNFCLSNLKETNQEITALENKLDDLIFELYGFNTAEKDLIKDLCEVGLEFFYKQVNSNAVKTVLNYPHIKKGTVSDLPLVREQQQGLEGYIVSFLEVWNKELDPEGEFRWQIIGLEKDSTQFKYNQSHLDTVIYEEWNNVLDLLAKRMLVPYNCEQIFIDGMVRAVTDTDILIIKRNERRFWTRSSAREDAEATLIQAMEQKSLEYGDNE
ncbi:MAG: HsdM family class I SAM-dependent methyltransferase, partial [Bacillota bacterium]